MDHEQWHTIPKTDTCVFLLEQHKCIDKIDYFNCHQLNIDLAIGQLTSTTKMNMKLCNNLSKDSATLTKLQRNSIFVCNV